MNFLLSFAITFFALAGITTLLAAFFDFELGDSNYWNHHGVWFLIFLSTFPRLTLLFSSVASGGLLWWLGWLFTPRFLVAILATLSYWKQNPVLVIIAWLLCFGGESGEKTVVTRRVVVRNSGRQDEVIDAEYKKI